MQPPRETRQQNIETKEDPIQAPYPQLLCTSTQKDKPELSQQQQQILSHKTKVITKSQHAIYTSYGTRKKWHFRKYCLLSLNKVPNLLLYPK